MNPKDSAQPSVRAPCNMTNGLPTNIDVVFRISLEIIAQHHQIRQLLPISQSRRMARRFWTKKTKKKSMDRTCHLVHLPSPANRAGTRHFGQLAFFARVGSSLSGNATPLQKMQTKGWTPSDCHASIAAGSSQYDSRRVRSWKHTDAGRSRVNGHVCCIRQPFPNLGRDLVRLPRTKSAG
jgi:hypothetical protein